MSVGWSGECRMVGCISFRKGQCPAKPGLQHGGLLQRGQPKRLPLSSKGWGHTQIPCVRAEGPDHMDAIPSFYLQAGTLRSRGSGWERGRAYSHRACSPRAVAKAWKVPIVA